MGPEENPETFSTGDGVKRGLSPAVSLPTFGCSTRVTPPAAPVAWQVVCPGETWVQLGGVDVRRIVHSAWPHSVHDPGRSRLASHLPLHCNSPVWADQLGSVRHRVVAFPRSTFKVCFPVTGFSAHGWHGGMRRPNERGLEGVRSVSTRAHGRLSLVGGRRTPSYDCLDWPGPGPEPSRPSG